MANPFKVGDHVIGGNGKKYTVTELGWEGKNKNTCITVHDDTWCHNGWFKLDPDYHNPSTKTYEVICNGVTKAYESSPEFAPVLDNLRTFNIEYEVYELSITRKKIR